MKGESPIPKIIPNARQMMLDEARRQVTQNGYAATTIRSIASACGIALGTMYNYFPSKDMLLASFMLEDWMHSLDTMNSRIAGASSTRQMLRCIYDGLAAFIRDHNALFSDPDALMAYTTAIREHHPQMRDQIATLIAAYSPDSAAETPFVSQFVAESMLTWSVEGVPFDTVYDILQKIIPEGDLT